MKTNKIRWRLVQSDIDRLSTALKPIRTYREVADMMGVSVALVSQLESSALGKVLRAVTEHEKNVNIKQNEQNGESKHE